MIYFLQNETTDLRPLRKASKSEIPWWTNEYQGFAA